MTGSSGTPADRSVGRQQVTPDLLDDIDAAAFVKVGQEDKYEPLTLPVDGADFQQIALPLTAGEVFAAGDYTFLFYDEDAGFTHDDAFTATFAQLSAATATSPYQLGLDPNNGFNAFYAYIGEAGGLPALFWDYRTSTGGATTNTDIQLQEVTYFVEGTTTLTLGDAIDRNAPDGEIIDSKTLGQRGAQFFAANGGTFETPASATGTDAVASGCGAEATGARAIVQGRASKGIGAANH